MQSRGLFDFFTKAADVQQTAAGARIARGQAAKAIQQQTSAAADKTYATEQKRRAGMTNQQRWDEDFNKHLSEQAGAGKNQYNFAYDNYSRDLDAAVARREISPQEARRAKRYTKNGIRYGQRAFLSNYLASFNGGDHTDADRNGIRDTKIWTTHGDNGLVHFRYGDFGENTTFGGAERGYEQRDARMAARARRGGARGGTSQMTNTNARNGNAMMRGGAQTNASNVTPTTPPSPTTFKGGHSVNIDPGAVDWSARGDGSINVRGVKLTQDQYDMYNNIRSQLAGSIAMQGGVDPQTARDQAGMLAAQYIGDQMNIANGGKAFNSWQHAEKQQAPQVTQTTPQPESPQASGGSINSTAALGEPAAAQPTAQQLESITSSAPVNTTDNLPLTLGGVPSFTTSEAPLTFSPPQPEPQPQPAPQPEPQPQPAPQPVTWDLEAGSKDPMGYIKHYTQALDADTIGRWNLKGKEREGWATQDGKLSAKGYFKGMAGRHYNNMQNLYKFVTDASLSDKDRYEVMKALNQEARRYDYYKEQSDLYRYPTAYDAKLHGPDSVRASIMEKQLAKGPVTFGWLYKNLAQDLKDYSDNYFSNNYYVKSIQ